MFKYIEEDDYKTLFSCILVNKQWHDINIPILWKNPFICAGSSEIILNCLLVLDKDFLKKNKIKLTFKLLNKQPLHNYATFTTVFLFLVNMRTMVEDDAKTD